MSISTGPCCGADAASAASSTGEQVPALHIQLEPASTLAVDSSELFRGGKLLHIHHDGEVYCLRTTRLGKLILTK
jgi:hemin uptake protein HemP